MARTFQWVGLPGSAISINSTVVLDETRGELPIVISESSISGTYSGPTDLVGVQSYSVTWLPSSTAGEFFEAGTVVLDREGGGTLIMQFASVFSGLTGRLTAPQTGAAFFESSFDGTPLTQTWRGEFEVVPAAPTTLGLFGGLLALSRRRR